jgi:hypothetical protein
MCVSAPASLLYPARAADTCSGSIRILYMPPVYAVVSFFSYRFFHAYTYYALVEVVYESVTLSAFMCVATKPCAGTRGG